MTHPTDPKAPSEGQEKAAHIAKTQDADLEWLHRFLNCTVFGPPESEIQRAHAIVDALLAENARIVAAHKGTMAEADRRLDEAQAENARLREELGIRTTLQAAAENRAEEAERRLGDTISALRDYEAAYPHGRLGEQARSILPALVAPKAAPQRPWTNWADRSAQKAAPDAARDIDYCYGTIQISPGVYRCDNPLHDHTTAIAAPKQENK